MTPKRPDAAFHGEVSHAVAVLRSPPTEDTLLNGADCRVL
jgi:hypothetical protein